MARAVHWPTGTTPEDPSSEPKMDVQIEYCTQ